MVSEACAQPRGSSAMAVSRVSSPPPTSNENSQPTAENWCFTQVSVRRPRPTEKQARPVSSAEVARRTYKPTASWVPAVSEH